MNGVTDEERGIFEFWRFCNSHFFLCDENSSGLVRVKRRGEDMVLEFDGSSKVFVDGVQDGISSCHRLCLCLCLEVMPTSPYLVQAANGRFEAHGKTTDDFPTSWRFFYFFGKRRLVALRPALLILQNSSSKSSLRQLGCC